MELDKNSSHVAYNEDGVDLDAHGIQALVDECKKPHQNLLNQTDSVTVISDINQPLPESLKNPGIHRVILRIGRNGGHWIAAVFNKTATEGTTYTWADSIGGTHYQELAQLVNKMQANDFQNDETSVSKLFA